MTPLMLAIKENNKKKNDYQEIIDSLMQASNVNLQAEKVRYLCFVVISFNVFIQYAKWSAIFFAMNNGDEEVVHLLHNNKAKLTIKDAVL